MLCCECVYCVLHTSVSHIVLSNAVVIYLYRSQNTKEISGTQRTFIHTYTTIYNIDHSGDTNTVFPKDLTPAWDLTCSNSTLGSIQDDGMSNNLWSIPPNVGN